MKLNVMKNSIGDGFDVLKLFASRSVTVKHRQSKQIEWNKAVWAVGIFVTLAKHKVNYNSKRI